MSKGGKEKSTGGKTRKADNGSEGRLRKEILDTALAMSRSGLSPCRSGNVSCRFADGLLITPSGLAYEDLKPKDIVFVAADGSVPGKQKKPSSEWQFHLAAYQARPDTSAVVHTHSTHAAVLASAGRAIPPFHYMVAVAGGADIPIVPYALFGSAELAAHVAQGLRDRKACLMAHHGVIATGETLARALELAHEVEVLAEQYYKLLLLGPPPLLSDAQMQEAIERFKTYGQNAQE
jgi:L-fuculose-phosphate aldolase